MDKKSIFKILAGVGAALAGVGIFKLVTDKDEEPDYDVVEDDDDFEIDEDVDEAEEE
jgi:hypothetical protein